jgi:hypothetical protein
MRFSPLLAAAFTVLACSSGGSGSDAGSKQDASSNQDGGGSSSSTARWLEPFEHGLPTNTPNLLVDGKGGVHVANAVHASSTAMPRYASCPSSCENAGQWRYGDIGTGPTTGGSDAHPTIALDANGHPRVMWVYGGFQEHRWEYAACDAEDCSTPGSWEVTELRKGQIAHPHQAGYFAIDPQGLAAYIADPEESQALLYAQCDGTCSNLDSWRSVKISYPEEYARTFNVGSLKFAGPGQPRAAFVRQLAYQQYAVSYAQCDGDCLEATNWQKIDLAYAMSNASVSLEIEPNGRVILAAVLGSEGDTKGKLALWSCDQSCGDAASWSNALLSPDPLVPESVALMVDGKGGLGLAVAGRGPTGSALLHLYVCAQDCLSDSSVWNVGLVDSGEALDKSDPVPPKAGCTTMGWRYFDDVTAVFHADKVRIAVGAVHVQGGWGRECKTSADCIAPGACVNLKCDNDCSPYPDIYMNRLYLLPN